MEFKRLSDVDMVNTVDQAVTVLIEKDGVIKRAPKNEVNVQADWAETDSSSPAFIKNKPSKELVYEWSFSADDEVYEIYENVDEDLSWLTKRQDNIGFEIVCENYARQYDYNDENGEHNVTYLQDVFAINSSMDIPYFSRYVNLPYYGEQQVICKETLRGEVYGFEVGNDYAIDDVTDRCFSLLSGFFFNIDNGLHCDFDNDGTPTNVENGGSIILESNGNPFKSVKIYKITR